MNATPETKYLVVSVRKSDGQTFFPENPNHRRSIDSYEDALNIAREKARKNSEDYMRVVYVCTPMVGVELDNPHPPVRITRYTGC